MNWGFDKFSKPFVHIILCGNKMQRIMNQIKSIDIEKIDYEDKSLVKNLIVELLSIIEELKKENQTLKDEINRLKGEKGGPRILPNVPKKENDINSKKEHKKRRKRSKKDRIKIDKTETMRVAQDTLPLDAIHKGYRSVVVQDIIIERNNTEFKIERYYSPSERKTYEADLPESVRGSEFGSNLKSFIVHLYYAGRVTELSVVRLMCHTLR